MQFLSTTRCEKVNNQNLTLTNQDKGVKVNTKVHKILSAVYQHTSCLAKPSRYLLVVLQNIHPVDINSYGTHLKY